MAEPTAHPAGDEPIYHAMCAWIEQWRSGQSQDPVWPTVDPDPWEDTERTVPRFTVPEHLFGPWEVHQRHLEMRQTEPPVARKDVGWLGWDATAPRT